MEVIDSEVRDTKINLYRERDARNYIKDGEPRALYWYRYRETFEILKGKLYSGRKIDSPLMLDSKVPSDVYLSNFCVDEKYNVYDLPIVVVGNNRLDAFSFDVRKKDRSVLNGVEYPGISATIAFSDNLAETCGGIFDRDSRRQDRMYCTTISEIEECNYEVYYLPTENQPLHVRLVNRVHESDPNIHLPPFKDRTALAETFSMGKCK